MSLQKIFIIGFPQTLIPGQTWNLTYQALKKLKFENLQKKLDL